ncbi:MAG: ATP phosphoribosyltransferase [Archaeoglobales archaeon]|nr:MAG: ATP phosphoribosyltransferase [Archaeoglobales archaeon]
MIVAIPNKGRLSEPSVELLREAGIRIENIERRLIVPTNNPNINVLFARAKDIPNYVSNRSADVGITGYDMVVESNAEVEILLKLGFGKARLVIAVPVNSEIRSIEDLNGMRVATEFKNIAERFFRDRGLNVRVVEVSGACENAPYIGIADAILDLTSTGTTLRMNNLRVVEEVLETEAVLIANRDVSEDFEVRALVTSVRGVLNAKGMMYLMMNVPENVLDDVKRIVPGLKGPTVMKVEDGEMLAVHVVVQEDRLFEVLERLKKIGARDILIIPIQRLIY